MYREYLDTDPKVQRFLVYRMSEEFIDKLVAQDKAAIEDHLVRTMTINEEYGERAGNKALEMMQRGDLIPVARVNCTEDQLFSVTNSQNNFWKNHHPVNVLVDNDRLFTSSATGDVYIREDGTICMFVSIGWAQIGTKEDYVRIIDSLQ